MNRHSRIIVILLLAVLVLLGTAITLFYIDVGKDARSSGVSSSLTGNTQHENSARVFKDSNGLWGLEDSSGTVILEPEWSELVPIGNSCFKAKLLTRADSLYGVIDSEGDVTVPFVYENIERQSDYIYAAELKDTGQYLFYGNDFSLLLPHAADSYYMEGTNLCVSYGEDEYYYKQGENLSLVKAVLPRYRRPVSVTLTIDDPELLAVMESLEWSDFADRAIEFLDAFRRNQRDRLEEITDNASLPEVIKALETKPLWTGKTSDSIYVYKAEFDGALTVYLELELVLEKSDEESENDESARLRASFRQDKEGQWKLQEVTFS